MIKTVTKVLFTILFIIISIYYFQQEFIDHTWKGYTPLIFNSNQDADRGVELLSELGFKNILHKNNVTVGINDYFTINEVEFNSIDSALDVKDYRYDSYISSIDDLFTSDNKNNIVYVKINRRDLVLFYDIYKMFSANAISYKIGNPLYLRIMLNYIIFALMLLLFSFGSKTRFVISLVSGILAYLFMDPSSVFSFISFIVGYFLIIMIVESMSFSNRYIKRNNIGIIRIILFILLFSFPTIIPGFLDYTREIYTPASINADEFNYSSMEKLYDPNSPSISNYFSHYAFQKTFIYGSKYMFPTYKNSVTIDEFNREDYYLSRYVKIVQEYDDEFLNEFLSYCDTTALGRFYLDYGRPFTLELNSLLSLYVVKKEYMQIGILACLMLISSLFFKKNGDKKLKY